MENRTKPTLIFDTCIHTGETLLPIRDIFEKMKFESGALKECGLPENELLSIVRNGKAFMTTGCTGCNRTGENRQRTRICTLPCGGG